ncbi:SMP-30/gluconolactonase/LRE family protein [Leucobacter sp. CSA1]|uniref:SMP-30/gluconolactonase/LRE family protein n=1 Tax=Leucobacter chromiisoli TaxID=2796471 RepID=A0A934Q716_9MICO|nr:SMP-30/gluconolactonase/LRE family protein [Leucobacter chromiisoli]MBK0418916.1 SMP-30/gluconolactonase/LRE family protein [Leucobacter chromiisoli]
MIRLEARTMYPEQALLGEGPVWHGDTLLWVDILRGRLLRSIDETTVELRAFDEPVSAVFPRSGGGYALLVNDRVEIVDAELRTTATVPVLPSGGELRLSDGAVGAAGELWFGSMRHDLAPGGALHRLRAGETEATVVRSDLGMANGIAFAADFSALYFVDSAERTVTVFDYDPETTEIANPRVLIEIDPGLGTPDGIAVDAVGGVWVSLWSGGRVRRVELDGRWSQEILVPATNVTSCAFGGPNLQTLFITSATVELDGEALAAQPAAGSIFGITLPIGGVVQQEATV